MIRTPYSIRGTYGSGKTPCTVICADTRRGTWYAVEGSANVNLSPEPLEDGTDVEKVADIDTFHWPRGVHTEDDLTEAIEA